MFEYEGFEYSLEEIQEAANKAGLSVEDYISKNNIVSKQEQVTTDDENFQQDGVAGADAPSVSVAPEDTELPQVDTSLDSLLSDIDEKIKAKPVSDQQIADFKSIELEAPKVTPGQEIQIERPQLEVSEAAKQKADEMETRSRLKTKSSISTSLNLIKGLNRSDIDWVQFNKNDASYNEKFLGENNYDDTLKQIKNLYLDESGLSEYDFEQLYADKVQELAENKSRNDLLKQDEILNQTLISQGIELTVDDKFAYQRKIEDEKETSFDKKFLDLLAKEKQIVNSLKTANPEEKAKLAVELTNITAELDRVRSEEIETPSFIDLFKKNRFTAASIYLAHKIIKSNSITGNVVEDMFDLDGNPIKYKTSDKKSINSDDLLQATKNIELGEVSSGMSKQEYYESLDKSNLINLYDSNILGSAKIKVKATSERGINYLKSLGLEPIDTTPGPDGIVDLEASKIEGTIAQIFEPTVLDLAKIKNKAFLNDLNLIQTFGDFYTEVRGYSARRDPNNIKSFDDRFKNDTDLYSFIDTYSNQRADIISKNKALRILSRFDVDPTTINDNGWDTAIDLAKTTQKAFDKSNFEVINSVSSNTEAKEELFNFLENNKEAIGDFKISDDFVEELKPNFIYKNAAKQLVNFTPDLMEFAFIGRGLKSIDKIAKVSKTINKISKPGLRRTALFGLAAAKEEYKMRTVFDENYHLGGGTAFVAVGALANKIPALTPFNILNKALQFPKNGVVFATSSEAALFFEGGIESVRGGKTFQRHLQETYGDYDEFQQRLIGNMVFGSMLHVQSSAGKAIENIAQGKRNFEWMSTAKLDNLNVASQSKLNAATRLYRSQLANSLSQGKSAKEFNESNLGKSLIENINKHGSIFAGTTAVLSKMRGEQDLKSGDVNRVESYYKKKHSKNIQNWRNIAGEKANIVYDKSGDRSNFKTDGTAELAADGVTIRVDLKRVADRGLQADPGLISHEINHRLTVNAFKKNPQAKTELFNQLKSEFPEVLSRIKEAYKEELAAGTAKLEDEYLSFFVQTLANKSNYNLFSAKLQGKNASSTWTRLVDYTNRWSRKRSGWTPFENGSEASKESIIRYYADLALGLKEARTTDADISILNKIGKTGFKENIQVTEPVLNTEAKEAFAAKDLNQLQKESSEVQEIYEGPRKQKAGETIEAYTDRLIEQANRLDRINELDSKGKDRTPEETAERRALKTQNSDKIIPKYNQYVDVLVNKKYKSVDEQAYTKEDFRSDLNLQILELMNTYQPSTGVEFNYYVYDNLPKRIPGILEGKVAKEFTKELSDASNKIIDAEITETIDANNKIQKEAVKKVIDPVKELGTKGFEVIETENADGTIKQERIQKEVLNLDKVTNLAEVTNKTYRGVKEQIGGRVAKEFFGIDPQKATDIKHDDNGRPVRNNKGKLERVSANLTYEGFGSEARKIQDIIQDYSKFKRLMKIINPKNVSSQVTELIPPGETVAKKIDVSRDTYGISTGIKNNMLNLFMNKTGVRSKGQTSQVEVRELKPELLNITPELHKSFIKENFGVTGKGEANVYNKAIGQNLKGFIDMISGSISNKYYRDRVIRDQGGFEKNELLLANLAAGKPNTMAAKQLTDAFKKYGVTEAEKFELYNMRNPEELKNTNPDLYEKYNDVLVETSQGNSNIAERNLIQRNNKAALLNKKLKNLTRFVTGDNSTQVDQILEVKVKGKEPIKIGMETKLENSRAGQIEQIQKFNEKGELIDFIAPENKKNTIGADIYNLPEFIEGKKKFIEAFNAYAKAVEKVSNGKEKVNKHRAQISKETREKLGKDGLNIQKDVAFKVPVDASFAEQHYLKKGGNFHEFVKKDGTTDIYTYGPDVYKTGAERLNGKGTLEFRIKLSLDRGKISVRTISEFRLNENQVENKTTLNIKTPQDFSNFIDKISKTAETLTTTPFAAKNLNAEFNRIIERSTGIGARQKISEVRAAVQGAKKGKFDIFISPSAEDFVGLLYKTLGKGKQGDADLAFYKKNLLDPFAKANNLITSERLALMRDYRALKKEIGVVPKNLRKTDPNTGFTKEQAVRTYIWNKQGMKVPGINKGDLNNLLRVVNKNKELKDFGDKLIEINRGDGYAKPEANWLVGSITTDLLQGINTTKRAKHLEQWQKNVDIIFSKDNLNKLEAAYGVSYRKAMENMLTRMKTGRNRTYGMDSLTGKFTDWINGSVGAIMFFNTRSAVLQTISAANFINFKDNNIFAAGKAFANQKQYWSDFSKLFNSEFLVARRDGLRMNVNEADIAEMAKKGGVRGVINELLRFGFTPTQLADSFAIASGGSTFYRNRIKTYEKQGLSKVEAERKAFEDFRENAEVSQQSSRPDMISQQQAGSLGRLVLAFANTPSQYARIIKKSALDLKNGRGDAKTNISKIVYYTFAQNLLFNALQQGLFALAFGDDEDDEKKKQKNIDVANGMANSLLRGMGMYGAATAAAKDAALRIYKESQKNQPKYEKAAIDFLNISPPVSSKYRKIASAGRTIQFAKEGDFENFSIDNPALEAGSKIVSATTNIPLDRLLIKSQNINDALNQDLEDWERIALMLGWSGWQLGIEEEKEKKKRYNDVYNRKTYKLKTYKLK